MEFNKLAFQFVREFKEFEPLLHEQIEYNGKLLNHVFFGVCNDRFVDLIEAEKDIPKIKRLFHFFERMAILGDRDVKDLLAVTILARMRDFKQCLHIAYKYMGPEQEKLQMRLKHFGGEFD